MHLLLAKHTLRCGLQRLNAFGLNIWHLGKAAIEPQRLLVLAAPHQHIRKLVIRLGVHLIKRNDLMKFGNCIIKVALL